MNTLIKGTFPVRFRRDGKDGVNVWLKYATVLDLYDSGTGKYYPSNNNIFNEPTAECKYIGIGKGIGDEPTQGQYYDWKKYIGDNGTSFTAKGQAIAHYTTLTDYDNATSKSVGLYLIDDSAGALLKYWNGSASESRSVTDGDAYTTADKHLWVKDGAKWNDLGEIQGPKGDPAYIDTVYLKGASYNSAGIPYAKVTITKNNTSRTYEASTRGLHAYKINRTTLAVTKIGAYDTYINTATADTLATEINKLDTTVFLAIVSFDACGFSSNLVTAIKQFGGNDIADLKAKRQAFCFLGYKGMAQGTALQVLNVGDAKIAEISSIVSNGVCQGSGQGGNSILSVTNYYLAGDSSIKEPEDTWVTNPSNSGFSASKPYLWGYEETIYSLSSATSTTPRVIGVWSKDGKGIKFITEYYLATSASSGVTKDRAKWDWTTTLQAITPTKKYLWNYEVITYTDSSITESDPCIIGVYGDKGDPGDDAVSYKLSSSISAIPLDNDAYPTVSSFTLTAYKFVGNASATFDDSYQLVAIISYSGSPTPITVNTKLGTSSKLTVYLRTNGLSSGDLIKDIRSVSCYLYHGSVALDSFNILPIKAGAAGVSYFPNMRGLWQPNANPPYSWKDGSRDMVVYNKGGGTAYLFAVKTAGATNITSEPMSEAGAVNTKDWVQADAPFSMLFGNFVYTDNASIGGFVFSEEQMRSTSTTDEKSPEPKGSNCNILINGNTGKFVANYATIRGEINATAGTFKNVKITNNCWIEPETKNGDGWFMRGGNDRNAAWWLGYSGKPTGQFTMDTVYDDGSNHPPTASLKFMTPNIQQGLNPVGLISAYSNINTPLANFSHANGVMVRICPSEGVGIDFTDNVGNANPIAFNGKGHGALNGVIQGYKLNVMSSGQIDISNGNTVYCNGNGTNLILPTRENCSNVLGTTGAFALDLTIIGASGASNFRVYGKYHNSTTDCYLLNNDHGDNWFATMSQGDVLTLKLIYTGTSFYAYIVNMQN